MHISNFDIIQVKMQKTFLSEEMFDYRDAISNYTILIQILENVYPAINASFNFTIFGSFYLEFAFILKFSGAVALKDYRVTCNKDYRIINC